MQKEDLILIAEDNPEEEALLRKAIKRLNFLDEFDSWPMENRCCSTCKDEAHTQIQSITLCLQ